MTADRKVSENFDGSAFRGKHFMAPEGGYGPGFIKITDFNRDDTDIGVGVLNLAAGETETFVAEVETVFILKNGQVGISINDENSVRIERSSLIEENPGCVHLPAGSKVTFICDADTEFSVYQSQNTLEFPAKLYLPEDTKSDIFGEKGVALDKPEGCPTDRIVRTVFDNSSPDPERRTHENVTLVVGEIVSLSGRWSSWPPHNHVARNNTEDNPERNRPYTEEAYFYRMEHPNGFVLSQLSDREWVEVHHEDVVLIQGNNHAQSNAPLGWANIDWVIYTEPGQRWDRLFDTRYET